ncbi:MoeA C-terminal region (domain IV), partial [Desulfovibrio litoralis DSM 11393]
ARNVASRQGREDYVRVRFEQDSNALLAYPLQGKSGLVKTLVEAQGLLRIPAELEGFEQGSEHDIILL